MNKILPVLISSVLIASCTKINYDKDVIPVFKQNHPKAEVTFMLPIGGHSLGTILGQKTDVVIEFTENGESLEEIWTATLRSGWNLKFKCKSSGRKCKE